MTEQENITYKLPQRLITVIDFKRTYRELKDLDEWFHQASIRSGGKNIIPPKTSLTLEEFANINNLSLLDGQHRSMIMIFMDQLSKTSPYVHMSFAVEPSVNFLGKIIVWLRANIDNYILLDVGLQPSLVAGCSLRTANKIFDMSLRQRFEESRGYLFTAINSIAVPNIDGSNYNEGSLRKNDSA